MLSSAVFKNGSTAARVLPVSSWRNAALRSASKSAVLVLGREPCFFPLVSPFRTDADEDPDEALCANNGRKRVVRAAASSKDSPSTRSAPKSTNPARARSSSVSSTRSIPKLILSFNASRFSSARSSPFLSTLNVLRSRLDFSYGSSQSLACRS